MLADFIKKKQNPLALTNVNNKNNKLKNSVLIYIKYIYIYLCIYKKLKHSFNITPLKPLFTNIQNIKPTNNPATLLILILSYKKLINMKTNIKHFIEHKTKNKPKKSNKKYKYLYFFWKLLKKKRHLIKYFFFKKKKINKFSSVNINTLNARAKFVISYKTSKKNLINKIQHKQYRTKNRVQNIDLKNIFQKWKKTNYKNYFYATSLKNKIFAKKIINLQNLIKHIITYKIKKRINKLLKNKTKQVNPNKIKITQLCLFQYINHNKPNVNKFNLDKRNGFIIKTRQKKPNHTKKQNIQINNIIITLKTKTKPKKQHQLLINIKSNKTPTNYKNSNINLELKKNLFKNCFSLSTELTYNPNKNPIIFLSSIPLLLFNSFGNIKNNKYKQKNNNNILITIETLKILEKSGQKIPLFFLLNNMFLKKDKAKEMNNYFPLYFFQPAGHQKQRAILTRLKTQMYHYNINNMSSVKYKTFFIFFVILFLERFLLKKIWLGINLNDPCTPFWTNHINVFLYNNLFLYKKFNKILPIRELLEILWITFKNHDLQILLLFLKKKIENSHFKKHKKLLSIFFDIVKKNSFIFTHLKIRGFFFDIRGKVGVSGNAKKRHHSFYIGKITTTSQNFGSYLQQVSVWTPTGQMGITCIIQY